MYSKSERIGTWLLVGLIILTFSASQLVDRLRPEIRTDFRAFEDEVDLFLARQDSLRKAEQEQEFQLDQDVVSSVRNKERFPFDPNKVGVEEWIRMGLSRKQAESVEKYKRKGGKFRKVEDLKKIYVIDEQFYESIAPFVTIEGKPKNGGDTDTNILGESPQVNTSSTYTSKRKFRKELKVIEINTADTLELKSLPGIGSSFARRIVKYRNLLGGYHSLDQLLEVYGMDEQRFDGFKAWIKVESQPLTAINVNTAEVKELGRHPYVDWNLARAIVNYREQHGSYDRLEDLKALHLVNEEIYAKIAPYLSVQ